jgi:hypothetical protein
VFEQLYLPSLLGGLLLGLSAAILLVFNGRIVGVSSIVGRLLGGQIAPNIAFVVGLLAGPILYATAYGRPPVVMILASSPLVLASGLLVGVGTRMGSGCTSGHGILGVARLSKRSLAATATFLAAGVTAATVMGLLR